MEKLIINRVKVSKGAGNKKSRYAQLVYAGEECGFVTEEGIFLKIFLPGESFGAFQNLFGAMSYEDSIRFLKKNWDSIYDNYNLTVRGK